MTWPDGVTNLEMKVARELTGVGEPTIRQVAARLNRSYESVNDALRRLKLKTGTRSALGLYRWLQDVDADGTAL